MCKKLMLICTALVGVFGSFQTCSFAADEEPPKNIPVFSKGFDNIADNSWSNLEFPENEQPPGLYYIELTELEGTVGCWGSQENPYEDGPNGVGKSTVLKAVCGLIQPWKGHIRFEGELLNGSTPAKNVPRGITFAPQGNRVFPDLSVAENLEIGGYHLPKKELQSRIEQVIHIFPILGERPRQAAGRLSGGEQQMLALARALVPRPKLLMLDEPSLGLSPGIVKDVFETIETISRDTGVSILLVEQKVRQALDICTRVYALKLGQVSFQGSPNDLKDDTVKLKELFL